MKIDIYAFKNAAFLHIQFTRLMICLRTYKNLSYRSQYFIYPLLSFFINRKSLTQAPMFVLHFSLMAAFMQTYTATRQSAYSLRHAKYCYKKYITPQAKEILLIFQY